MRRFALPLFAAALTAAILAPAVAEEFRHPHLRAAHEAIDSALQSLREASNGPAQFGGHRERAEELLHQAQREIHEAAEFADSHRY
jgi:hypothetical protein